MFPSASLEERHLNWLALWSMNHALVSRKIFRAYSLLLHPSVHPSVIAPSPDGPITPSSPLMLLSPLWVGYLLFLSSIYTLFAAATSAIFSLGKPLAKHEITS